MALLPVNTDQAPIGEIYEVPTTNNSVLRLQLTEGAEPPVVNRVFDFSWGTTWQLNPGSPSLLVPIPWVPVEEQNLDVTLSIMASFQNDSVSDPALCTLQYGPSQTGSFLPDHSVLFGNTLGPEGTLQLPLCRRWIIPYQQLGDQLDLGMLFEAPSVTVETPVHVAYIEIAWAAVAPGANTPFG